MDSEFSTGNNNSIMITGSCCQDSFKGGSRRAHGNRNLQMATKEGTQRFNVDQSVSLFCTEIFLIMTSVAFPVVLKSELAWSLKAFPGLHDLLKPFSLMCWPLTDNCELRLNNYLLRC